MAAVAKRAAAGATYQVPLEVVANQCWPPRPEGPPSVFMGNVVTDPEPLPHAARRLFGLRLGGRDGRVSVLSSVLGFALSGLLALALVAGGVLFFARRTATDQAVEDASNLTETVGRGVIEPSLQPGILRGDPDARSELDHVVRTRVLSPSIVRVKLWTRDGTVVYSDEPRLNGQQFTLSADDIAAFGSDRPAADITDLQLPENAYEQGYGKLLQVYFQIHAPSGEPLLFEAYLPYSTVSANASAIWRSFLPAFVAGLIVLALVQVPLAWSLAARLQRRQDEREQLLRRAVEASDRERRLIASELHDGAVQDLLGQSYALTATAERLVGIAPEDAVQDIRDASAQTRTTVQELRTLLVDLYPPNLRTEGLEHALADLATPLRARGIVVDIVNHIRSRPTERTERLLYRAARESLRNVVRHANATAVQILIEQNDGHVRLSVTDNGRGYSAETRDERRREGHVGLDLVESLVKEAGGVCETVSVNEGGTRFSVEAPDA